MNFKFLKVQFEQKMKKNLKTANTFKYTRGGDKYFRIRKQEELNSEGRSEQKTQRKEPNQPKRGAHSNSLSTLTV